jgi:hypothetical protein
VGGNSGAATGATPERSTYADLADVEPRVVDRRPLEGCVGSSVASCRLETRVASSPVGTSSLNSLRCGRATSSRSTRCPAGSALQPDFGCRMSH